MVGDEDKGTNEPTERMGGSRRFRDVACLIRSSGEVRNRRSARLRGFFLKREKGGSGGVVTDVVPGTGRYPSPCGTSHGTLVRGWFWIVNGKKSELGNRAPVRMHVRTGEARILAREIGQWSHACLASSLSLTIGVLVEEILEIRQFLAGRGLGFGVSTSSCQQPGVHEWGQR